MSESTPEPYTPSTTQIRDGYRFDPEAEHYDPITNHAEINGRAFDRWLARHDAEVAAKALRDAADSVSEVSGVLSVLGVCRALRDRAARISSGGES